MFIVQIKGGLGNRIFQYNFCIWLAHRFPDTEIYACTADEPEEKTHPLFRSFPVLSRKRFLKKALFCTRIDDQTFSLKKIRAHGNYYFDGYWMAEIFQEGDELFRLFLDTVELNEHNREMLANIQETESVFCHIRRGDMHTIPIFKNIATREYFENALEYMERKLKDPVFFIFSDDPEWCRSQPFFQNRRVVFQELMQTAPDQDLFLMSHCRHAICSYSSFSCWGQKLISGDGHLIVTPPRYLNTSQKLPMPVFHAPEIPNIRENGSSGENPLFSIIICCWRAESFIRTCLVSICNQCEKDFEIICVDDCSQDRTADVIKSFMALDKRIRYIRHEENLGQFSARRTGILAARGKYCWIVDSDDYLVPDALRTLRGLTEQHPDADIIRFRFQEADYASNTEHPARQNFEPAGVFSGERLREWCLSMQPTLVAIWQNLFRRDFLLGSARWILDLPAVRRAEDLLYFLIPFHAQKIFSVENVLYNYRINEGEHDSMLSSPALLEGIIRNSALTLHAIDELPITEDQKEKARARFADGFMTRVSSCLVTLPFRTILSRRNDLLFIARNASEKSVRGIWKLYPSAMKQLPDPGIPLFLILWSLMLKVKNIRLILKRLWRSLPVSCRDRIAFCRYALQGGK